MTSCWQIPCVIQSNLIVIKCTIFQSAIKLADFGIIASFRDCYAFLDVFQPGCLSVLIIACWVSKHSLVVINTLRPRQNGRHFGDDTLNRIFLNENVRISIKISLKFAPKGPINNIPSLVQIMAWRRPGDTPLSEPMVVSLLTHICVARPQWYNTD